MAEQSPHWNQICVDPVPAKSRLEHVRYCSPFAAGLIDRHPEWLEQLEAGGRLDELSPPDPRRAAEWKAAHGLDDGLRAFRNQEMLRIVWRDLNGLAPLGEVLSDLTVLAEVCLQHVVEAHYAVLAERYGEPLDDQGKTIEPVVIGLGKLGGGELNLSSDIDVLFCFPAPGRCSGPRAVSAEEFFARFSRAVIASLGEVRPSGFCFRVDTRLRPFGQAGPIACSFAALEQYYQREGRNWERYALVKARPVAGDPGAGARLLDSLRPFIYRRYIDFGAIESLREMQALIRTETARRDLEDDIKRGPGGIREIEFLAQGFQLLRGGREPILQTPRLWDALSAIERLGLLPADLVDQVRQDYIWLRHVENRVQALADQQSHRIPKGENFDRLLCGMGGLTSAAFERRLDAVRDRVSAAFDSTWAANEPGPSAAETPADRWKQQWSDWLAHGASPEDTAADELEPAIRSFLSSLARRPMGQGARRRLDRFMPMLLERTSRQGVSPQTRQRLLDLVLVICRRSAYLSLLAENPAALDRTVELFSRSPWVAQRVARFPELLDELIDPALGHHIPDQKALETATSRRLELDDEEAVLSGLNYLKQATCLRLAVAFLEGRIAAEALQASLTSLAEVMVRATLRLAQSELESRHGRIPDAAVAVIAYGSLGARELGFESDLDLVFLYREGHGESAGKRPLASERWFARLAQRMVALLTALTPSGKLYDIDTRLRPNGQSGLLVSSISAFEAYQRESAWTWEAQALTRARAIAGDPDLMAAFEEVRLASLCRRRDRRELGKGLLEMRQRIRTVHGEGETGGEAIKHGPGGLVDIGFIAQLGVLSLAHDHPEVSQATGAAAQVRRLHEFDWLDDAQYELVLSRLAQLRDLRVHFELDAINTRNKDELGEEEAYRVAGLLPKLAEA